MRIKKFNENNKHYINNKIFGYNQFNSISESGVLSLLEKYGKEYDKFFTETSLGQKGKSYKDYIEFYENLPLDKISNIFKKHDKGNFSDHIAKSIPGHKEVQKLTAFGVVKLLINKKNSIVLDIGGSDNTWAKTISDFSNGKIKSITIDPNTTMKELSDKISIVKGNIYKTRSFMDSFDDIKALEEDEKFDCVHESMTFQFISDKRGKHIDYIKNKLLKKGGFVLLEEKFYNDNWNKFEEMKDDYKKKYFSEEDIAKKGKKILKQGMNKNMIKQEKFENILSMHFKYYEKYWDGGNFMGYIASDKKIKINKFLNYVRLPRFKDVLFKFLSKSS